MTQLTPRDDIRKKVSQILKRVDQLIKTGSLDQAMFEVERAKHMDPRNVYIQAYEERLLVLLRDRNEQDSLDAAKRAEDHKRKIDAEAHKAEESLKQAREAKRKADETSEKKKEPEAKTKDVIRVAEDRRRLEEQKSPPPKTFMNDDDKTRDFLQRLKEEELQRRREGGPKLGDRPTHYVVERSVAVAAYKKALSEAWKDGIIEKHEEKRLAEIRTENLITDAQHLELEKEVRLEAYVKAFKEAWTAGKITPDNVSALSELRKKFRISTPEHDEVETRILWEIRSSQDKPRVMVIDDDERLLDMLSVTLDDAGFDTIALTTTDEAFRMLKLYPPDLILSDINLETSTMGGFTFFEKVREIEELADIPFIFLSGLTDEVLIRTGKELGVDDYITKPFSDEVLIATIKGKLKRYKQMKKKRL